MSKPPTTLRLEDIQKLLTKYAEKLTQFDWYWEDEPIGYLRFPYGIMSGPTSIRAVGSDEVFYTEETDGSLTPRVEGQRMCIINMKVYNNDQSAKVRSQTKLEQLRVSFSLPSIVDAFSLMGIAVHNQELATIMDINAPNSLRDRIDSIASVNFDFMLDLQCLSGEIGDAGRLEALELASEALGIPPFTIDSTP